MMSQEQILASVAADLSAPKHRGGPRNESTMATWIQSTRSPVLAARYADSVSKGMDQRVQGMLQNKRRVSGAENESRKNLLASSQPPPPSSPPPPGQRNVSPGGDGIRYALSGLAGATDSGSLHKDISSKVDQWLRTSSPLDGADDLDNEVPLNSNGETLDFEQFQAWEKRKQDERRRYRPSPEQLQNNKDDAALRQDERASSPPKSLETQFEMLGDTQKPAPARAVGDGEDNDDAGLEDTSDLSPAEALKQVRALAEETLASLGMAQFDVLQSQLAGLVVLCDRGLEKAE